jgi:hypothetical protein
MGAGTLKEAPTGVMMKLSEDGKKWVNALLSKSTYEIALWIEEDHRRVVAIATKSNPAFPQMTAHYIERARRSMMALLNAYIEGYKVDEALIDDEDNEEILEEVRVLLQRQLHHLKTSATNRDFRNPYTGERIPNIETHLAARIDSLIGEAAIELNLARNKMVIEQKKKAALSKENFSSINYTTYVENNYGNIQQGGENNNQTINSNKEPE